ncbi:MAG: isoaspartyl peptidase/L-asparaginase [Chloroflexi bacterium]|nr:isoaspartyl peptidase/L-asparaginase [Chloroflexota bacterium]
MTRPLIIIHGGAGAPPSLMNDGCEAAAKAAVALLRRGRPALDAVIEAVRLLENDGRFNAGSGSVLRLDGVSVEMDASVMDSTGTLGAVAGLSSVRNPVLVARRVADTPHVFMAGPGAIAFARTCGFRPYAAKVSRRAIERHKALLRGLMAGDEKVTPSRWRAFDLRRYWNFERSLADVQRSCDTVGAVAIDERGTFAVAGSTGGASPMLRGRVGDTPLIGCGFYAGEYGAVAATGIGEEIIRRMLCRRVYDDLASGIHPQQACEQAATDFPADAPVGLIAVTAKSHAVASNVPMAQAILSF